jgi:hypothetical protein
LPGELGFPWLVLNGGGAGFAADGHCYSAADCAR